jgi:hypothetical protein
MLGAAGAVVLGTMELDAAEDGLTPAVFVATTVKV